MNAIHPIWIFAGFVLLLLICEWIGHPGNDAG